MGGRSHRRGPEGSARHERRHSDSDQPAEPGVEESQNLVRDHLADMLSSPGFDVADDPDGVTFDFDKHWANKKKAAKVRSVRIYQRVYVLPSSMPAKVMFMSQQREFRNSKRKVSQEEGYNTIREMLDLALRPGAVAQMLDDGIEMDELPDVLAYVMGHFDHLGHQLVAGGGEGDGQGEASGGRRPATSGTRPASSGS